MWIVHLIYMCVHSLARFRCVDDRREVIWQSLTRNMKRGRKRERGNKCLITNLSSGDEWRMKVNDRPADVLLSKRQQKIAWTENGVISVSTFLEEKMKWESSCGERIEQKMERKTAHPQRCRRRRDREVKNERITNDRQASVWKNEWLTDDDETERRKKSSEDTNRTLMHSTWHLHWSRQA